jgi:hypothetical protein
MFVESIANREAKVEASTPLGEVLPMLQHYPGLMVTDQGRVVGGLSRGQLFHMFADMWMTSQGSAPDILQGPAREHAQDVPVFPFGTPVENAVQSLVGGAVLAIVVDRRNEPYGVISWMEVNQYLREITGMDDRKSVRFSLALVDMPGQLARVAEVVGRAGANITALTLSDPKVLNWVHVVLRVDRDHADIARGALERAGIDIIAEHNPS